MTRCSLETATREGGCSSSGRVQCNLPVLAKVPEGLLRRDLLLSAWLSSGLRPVNLFLGLWYYIYRVTTLQALQIFSVHVPVPVDVSSTPGTCLEINHRTSFLPFHSMRIDKNDEQFEKIFTNKYYIETKDSRRDNSCQALYAIYNKKYYAA